MALSPTYEPTVDYSGRPVVREITELVYEQMGALTARDEEQGYPLLLYVDAICRNCMEEVWTLFSDHDDQPGWAILFDVDSAPVRWLPYLAQYAGVTLDPKLNEAEQREKIRTPEGFRCGTPEAIRQVLARTLTGSKTVLIRERHMGSAYKLWVRSLVDETPDLDVSRAALLTQKPIGVVLTYEAVSGQSWSDLITRFDTWADVVANYATWQELIVDVP